MAARRATIFGGSGFIGRYIVRRLAAEGTVVRVAVRRPNEALFLKPMGNVGQIVPVAADVRDAATVQAAVRGADQVVNVVSLYVERGRATFEAVHETGAEIVARAAAEAGVGRLVHFSGIGADPNSISRYARVRARGEQVVRAAFPSATIMRPSVVFGPEDALFNRLAAIAQLSPVMPLFGGGKTRLQPVYVGDVAQAVHRALHDPAAPGRVYELGGPRVYTLRELHELLLAEIQRRRLLVPVPFVIAEIIAMFLGLLPNPPLTREQVKLLRTDNVVTPGALSLADLGIRPTAAEVVLPTYLDRFRRGGRRARRLYLA
ncbi:MAG TPA: complex I NDUFA9 subunit family protein [Alphaproteobacteria bacterium]|jgi:NADH dehydrogenase